MTPALATMIGVVAAGIPAFVAGLLVRRKTKADAADVITQAAARVVEDLTRALDDAKETAVQLRREVVDLRAEVAHLREVIIGLGGDPGIARHPNY